MSPGPVWFGPRNDCLYTLDWNMKTESTSTNKDYYSNPKKDNVALTNVVLARIGKGGAKPLNDFTRHKE